MDIQTYSKFQSAYEQSGLSIKAYCLEAGLIYTTVLYWRKKYSSTKKKSPSTAPNASSFIELVANTSKLPDSTISIKCSIGPVTIYLPHDSSPSQWRNFLTAACEVFPC